MLFANNLVLCEESRLEVEQQLDRWREVLEEMDQKLVERRQNPKDPQDPLKTFA